jgi:hypothetical protein
MNSILDLLVNTLIERFIDAGFEVPNAMTQKQRECFALQSLDEATILSISDYNRLVAAGHEVVNCWENGNLAQAVRTLDHALPK